MNINVNNANEINTLTNYDIMIHINQEIFELTNNIKNNKNCFFGNNVFGINIMTTLFV